MPNIAPAPIGSKFLNADGTVNYPWIQWFSQVTAPAVSKSLSKITLTGDVSGESFDNIGTIDTSLVGAASGDLSGHYPTPTVVGIEGAKLPTLSAGNLRSNGTTWIFDAAVYALDSAVVHNTLDESIDGNKTFVKAMVAAGYKVGANQVVGAQQTGMGTTLGAATLTGTYATDLAALQALYNKMVLLESKLKNHGLVAT